jgi:hypothetical protein
MKKLAGFVLSLMIALPLCASTTYYVSTNRGEQPVVIPDNSTEHDVLLALASSYYNLNDDYENLKVKINDLTTSLNSYIEENKQLRSKYDSLIVDYDLMIKKYQQLYSTEFFKGIAGVSTTFDNSSIDTASIQLGALFLEKIGATASIGYSNTSKNLLFGFGLTYIF